MTDTKKEEKEQPFRVSAYNMKKNWTLSPYAQWQGYKDIAPLKDREVYKAKRSTQAKKPEETELQAEDALPSNEMQT